MAPRLRCTETWGSREVGFIPEAFRHDSLGYGLANFMYTTLMTQD